jgi:hypothetical protein
VSMVPGGGGEVCVIVFWCHVAANARCLQWLSWTALLKNVHCQQQIAQACYKGAEESLYIIFVVGQSPVGNNTGMSA